MHLLTLGTKGFFVVSFYVSAQMLVVIVARIVTKYTI